MKRITEEQKRAMAAALMAANPPPHAEGQVIAERALVLAEAAISNAQKIGGHVAAVLTKKRKEASAKGGRAKKLPDWHTACVSHAKTLIATGTERHELAGKCARKFKVSQSQARRLLQRAGLIKTRAK